MAARADNLPQLNEKLPSTVLSRLRVPSNWGTPSSDSAIEAIRVQWTGEAIAHATKCVNASMGDVKNPRPAHGTFAHRRMQAASINAVEEGRFVTLVEELLASRYDPVTFQNLKLEGGVSQRLNIYREVLDKADVTVSEGMDFSLSTAKSKPEGQEDAADKRLKNMMDVTRFSRVIQRLSRKCYGHKAMCAMPDVVFSDRIGKRVVAVRLFDPGQFDLVCTVEGAPWDILVIYNVEADKRTLYTSKGWVEQYLDKDSHDWKNGESGRNPGGGGIDAVIFTPVDGATWWEEAYGPQLVEHTVVANSAETFIDWLMSTQVKMPAGDQTNTAKGQKLIQGSPLNLGVGGTAQMLDFQLDIPKLVDVYITRERDNAERSLLGMRESETNVAPATSGVAERIKFWARDRLAIKRREWLLPLAVELYWVLVKVIASAIPEQTVVIRENEADGKVTPEQVSVCLPIEGFDGGYMDDGNPNGPPEFTPPNPKDVLPPFTAGVSFSAQPVQLMIDVREVGYPETPAEQAATDENMLKHNRTTEARLMLRDNPDLGTVDAARQAILANKAENAGTPESTEPAGDLAPEETTGASSAANPDAKQAPSDGSAPVDASGKVDAGTTAAVTLNGAQITSALEVVQLYAKGIIARVVCVELLVSVGIAREQANQMADAQDKMPKPEVTAPVHPAKFPPAKSEEDVPA